MGRCSLRDELRISRGDVRDVSAASEPMRKGLAVISSPVDYWPYEIESRPTRGFSVLLP